MIVTSTMASAFVSLNTKFPCCGKKSVIRATNDVPHETYDRTCKCGQKWSVDRVTLRQGQEVRMDKLEWTPEAA